MKSHCVFFAEPERKVIEMPVSPAERYAQTTRFQRWFGFWWTFGWLAAIALGIAWMSATGGK